MSSRYLHVRMAGETNQAGVGDGAPDPLPPRSVGAERGDRNTIGAIAPEVQPFGRTSCPEGATEARFGPPNEAVRDGSRWQGTGTAHGRSIGGRARADGPREAGRRGRRTRAVRRARRPSVLARVSDERATRPCPG